MKSKRVIVFITIESSTLVCQLNEKKQSSEIILSDFVFFL